DGVLNLADWARELVAHWHEWTQMIWGWVFALINIKLPEVMVPMISFGVFAIMLVMGVNLRNAQKIGKFQGTRQVRRNIRILVVGLLLYLGALAAMIAAEALVPSVEVLDEVSYRRISEWLILIGLPIPYLLYFGKERLWIVIASLLFLFMSGC